MYKAHEASTNSDISQGLLELMHTQILRGDCVEIFAYNVFDGVIFNNPVFGFDLTRAYEERE